MAQTVDSGQMKLIQVFLRKPDFYYVWIACRKRLSIIIDLKFPKKVILMVIRWENLQKVNFLKSIAHCFFHVFFIFADMLKGCCDH